MSFSKNIRNFLPKRNRDFDYSGKENRATDNKDDKEELAVFEKKNI